MFVSAHSSFSTLVQHRDLLLKKISMFKLQAPKLDSEPIRSHIYDLKEDRAFKQRQLNSMIGKIKSKSDETLALRDQFRRLELFKNKLCEEYDVLVESRNNRGRQARDSAVDATAVRREINALVQKREGLKMSSAEIELVIHKVGQYTKNTTKTSDNIKGILKSLQSKNNNSQVQINEVYLGEQKNIDLYGRAVREAQHFESLCRKLSQEVNRRCQELQTVNCKIASSQEIQLKIKHQTDLLCKKISYIEGEQLAIDKQNCRLTATKEDHLKSCLTSQKDCNESVQSVRRLQEANKVLEQTLAHSTAENNKVLLIYQSKPSIVFTKHQSPWSTGSEFNH